MDRTKNALLDDLKTVLLRLAKEHDVRAAYVFGSYAMGSPGEHSDVDVAIVLGRIRDGSPFDERFEIFHELQQHNSLFEVVCFQEAEFAKGDEELIRRIEREGIRIL